MTLAVMPRRDLEALAAGLIRLLATAAAVMAPVGVTPAAGNPGDGR